jgi:hypothetical protein
MKFQELEIGKICYINEFYEALVKIADIDDDRHRINVRVLATTNPTWIEPTAIFGFTQVPSLQEVPVEDLPLYIGWPVILKNFTDLLERNINDTRQQQISPGYQSEPEGATSSGTPRA